MKQQNFTLTLKHIKLLAEMAKGIYLGGHYENVPAFDSKRPYGNSDYIKDMAELLDIEYPDDEQDDFDEKYEKIYNELTTLQEQLPTALKIVLQDVKQEEFTDREYLITKNGYCESITRVK